MRLTDLGIRALPVPKAGQKTYYDDALPGFGVRVSYRGSRSFILMHGRSRTLTTLGRVGVLTLGSARAEAKRVLAERTLGRFHPRSEISFGEAVEKFLERHEGKESTKEEYRGTFRRHYLAKFRLERIDRIRTNDITRIIDKLSDRPAEAAHAHAAASVLFNWARSRRYIERSPLEGVKKPFQGPPKERVLTDDEIKTIFLTEDQSPMSFILRLTLLTGQRPGQIGALRAEYIHEDRIIWPAAMMKWQRRYANRQHIVPIAPMAAAILDGLPTKGYLFPSRTGEAFTNWSNGKRVFDALSGLSDYTCQDCRRTTSTKMGDLEILPHVIDVLQAHRFQGLSAVHSIYNKAIYFEPMRNALHTWEAWIEALLSNTESMNGADLPRPHHARA